MLFRTAAWGLLAFMGTMPGAQAADATPEGAATVQGQLERYLGHGPVAVLPSGTAYRIDIDLQAASKGLRRFGISLDPVTISLTAAPQDNGTWRVTSGTAPLITVKAGDQTTSVVANNQKFDGVFDPRIPAFTQSTSSYDSLSIGTTSVAGAGRVGGAVQTRELTGGTQTLTATPAGDGMIDAKVTQGNATYGQDFAFDMAKGAQHVTVKGGQTTDVFTVEKLPIRALLDLWTFLVAHPSAAELKGDGAGLKDRLRHALPGFARLKQDGTLASLAVQTPFGPMGARALATHFDLTGLTDSGSATLAVKIDDLALPTTLLPAWAPALLPTSLDLNTSVAGYRLDQAAAAAIDDMDVGAAQPWPPAAMAKITDAFGSRDHLVVTLGDNHIVTPTFDARFSGEIRLATSPPAFTLTVHAHGLDKALVAIQTKAADDPTAARAIALLTLVKGYGKSEGEDALAWALAGDGTGAFTVNGAPLPFGSAK